MWSRSLSVLCILIVFSTSTLAGRYGSSRSPTGHSYPHSTGYSGTGRGPQTTNTGTGQQHSYPQSTGYSGNRANQGYRPTTTVHHHYHYNPPQQVHYGSGHHPVYHGQPPVYVYQYRDSGSRFNTLLAGLALYNLGRMSSGHHSGYQQGYRSNPGETCKLGVRKDNGDYEESRVDCRIMTSFILDADTTKSEQTEPVNVHTVTTTTNSSIGLGENGTAVNNTVVTVTTVDALQDKGPPIQVTPKMQCYMIHVTYSSTNKKSVPCGLLQAYAESSLRRSSAARLVPFTEFIIALIIYYFKGYLFTDT